MDIITICLSALTNGYSLTTWLMTMQPTISAHTMSDIQGGYAQIEQNLVCKSAIIA